MHSIYLFYALILLGLSPTFILPAPNTTSKILMNCGSSAVHIISKKHVRLAGNRQHSISKIAPRHMPYLLELHGILSLRNRETRSKTVCRVIKFFSSRSIISLGVVKFARLMFFLLLQVCIPSPPYGDSTLIPMFCRLSRSLHYRILNAVIASLNRCNVAYW